MKFPKLSPCRSSTAIKITLSGLKKVVRRGALFMKSFLKVVFFVVALVVALRACGPFHSGGQLVGRPAPDFTLASVHGPYVNMTEFRGGEPALIFFWATWCPHCRTQLKELTQKRAPLQMK